MTGSEDDPVTSVFFTDVQLFVGFFQKRGNIAVEIVFYQSEGQGDGEFFRTAVKDKVSDFLPEYFQRRSRFIPIQARKNQKKLFAAPTGNKGIGRQSLPKSVGMVVRTTSPTS